MPFARTGILVLAIFMLAGAALAADEINNAADDRNAFNPNAYGNTNAGDNTTPDDNMNGSASRVMLSTNETLGSYLVNETGYTLYYFLNDTPGNGTSTCYGGCLVAWPAFYMDAEDMDLPEGLSASDFTEANRTDDIEQTAYKGWPLYFYYEDKEPGDIFGQGVNDVWFIVVPDEFTPIDA